MESCNEMDAMHADRVRKRQRVLLLGSYGPSLVTFRGPLIAEMVRRGHEVFAASADIDETLAASLRALGATPVPVRLGRGSLNPFHAIATLRELRLLVRRLHPDVTIAYTILPIVLGALAAEGADSSRFVALITGVGYPFTRGREPKRLLSRAIAIILYRRALRKADVAIFQNNDDRRDFRKLRLLPSTLPTGLINGSGVDINHFKPAKLPEGLSFLMIARFLKGKGIREYGEAAKKLKQSHPQVRIALAGWMDHSPDSISPAELGSIVASGVQLIGKLDDVRQAISSAAVYVLPSYREGTPRSVLEAMAMARAIITTDAPGCRETVVHGQNG